ncbi:sigma 54-interacting transcriptional regulator [Pseudomonas sp. DWRC2-2]|uniref:sigma 54-interacting transcriptional regulator n=1 Tax=Pseudomonas sp. DWRC2-2 TaxID=2804567 RepID=UPI003CE957D6
MRIHVSFTDRVGITKEVLAILGARNLNLKAVEMSPPNVYIDAPALDIPVLEELRSTLLAVPGVCSVEWVDILPGDRRRLQLDSLLATVEDPTIAIDLQGKLLLANSAFCQLIGNENPTGPLADILGDSQVLKALLQKDCELVMSNVMIKGTDYLMESTPVGNDGDGDRVAGTLISFYPPRRVGERLAAMHEEQGVDELIGMSSSLESLKCRIKKLAVFDVPILIQGETGTGKELVARACHLISNRRNRTFLALNCAALPESLAESELFGYSAGAFTGAQRGGKPGLLELADGGTIFLDEIGEMSLYLQAKILRFLNDGTFRRVGGDREIEVNVKVLAATHRNLETLVGQGAFREDLYYRLNVLNINVPALRDRGQDILLLASFFLRLACTQIGTNALRLSTDAQKALLANSWPGNVRQLKNIIFRAAATTEGSLINAADLELDVSTSKSARLSLSSEFHSLGEAVQMFERELLTQLLPKYPTTRLLAARLKTSHTAIGQRLRKYGIC